MDHVSNRYYSKSQVFSHRLRQSKLKESGGKNVSAVIRYLRTSLRKLSRYYTELRRRLIVKFVLVQSVYAVGGFIMELLWMGLFNVSMTLGVTYAVVRRYEELFFDCFFLVITPNYLSTLLKNVEAI